ncbi:UNVERIFIED_CONTAM: hypothetical protein Slati_1038900 [Sesamum latifolium]|uniref:Uncharacterized protein n=1 Tax=Sesamum latifolium TaxID=2727402 RepID=A0AAW2XSK0_9LAMI
MSTTYLFLFVIGLIILPITTSFTDHNSYYENSLEGTKLNTRNKYLIPLSFESKAIVKRPGKAPVPGPPRKWAPRRPAHRSPAGPPARKGHPPSTQPPAGSSNRGGKGAGRASNGSSGSTN